MTVIKILHVINDISADMRYGGPAMNCLRHSQFLESEKTEVTVWGTYSSLPLTYKGKSKIFLANTILFPRYRFTFQFGIKNFGSLVKAIKKSDVIHVHFARELNPVLASVLALLLGKKLILQTHGMIVQNPSSLYKIWDILFTNRIFARASLVLPLQRIEELDLRKFPIKRFLVVPNGIEIDLDIPLAQTRKGIVFISRIHERKRPDIFVSAAAIIERDGYVGGVSIYGEDAGFRIKLLELLEFYKSTDWYKGGISHRQALEILSGSELLILPSHHEPFPMVVLESLVAGTPVIIMNDCGIADMVSKLDSLFVCSSDPLEIASRALEIISKYKSVELRSRLATEARESFSIDRTIEGFMDAYFIATEGKADA